MARVAWRVRVRRAAGGLIDLVGWALLLFTWGLPVAEALSLDPDATRLVGVGGARGGLTGTEVGVFGLGLTGILIALQVPFLWRGQTLGMAATAVQARSEGRQAPVWQTVPWALLSWGLALGVLLAPSLFVPPVRDGAYGYLYYEPTGGGWGVYLTPAHLPALVALLSAGWGLATGRSPVDRLVGVTVAPRAAPEVEPGAVDETGWRPREGFTVDPDQPVDPQVTRWREATSADPLAPFLGPGVAPIPEAPPEPEHVDHVEVSMPSSSRPSDASEEALLARLRAAVASPGTGGSDDAAEGAKAASEASSSGEAPRPRTDTTKA